MASISAVRDALADTIAGVDDLRVVKYLTDQVNLPAAAVEFGGYQTVSMGRGTVTMQFDVTVIVPLSHGRISTTRLDDLVAPFGTGSIPNAIWSAHTLGIDGCNAHVAQVSGYTQLDGFGIEHMASTITVVIHTRGDQ